MNPTIAGIHHVTAITANAQQNVDFYCGTLGLHLVKVTVNFDDRESYHLYYGDELGRPGTIITFFAWPGGHRGRIGPPQVTTTAFAVPRGALDYWSSRLAAQRVDVDSTGARFGDALLQFADPDGLKLEIVAADAPGGEPWRAGPIPVEHAIRGFHSVTIAEEGYESTARVLSELMGFQAAGSEQNRFRYLAGAGDGFASTVDLLCAPDGRHGGMGAGVVHHVAFRTADRPQQDAWRKRIVEAGMNVSPVMDRNYFQSIYYREPGGVLFEIATDSPGFAVDEPPDALGTMLKLPQQYEAYRAQLEKLLPPLKVPARSA